MWLSNSLILLLYLSQETLAKKSEVLNSEDRTNFACNGSPLLLKCDNDDDVILVTRANYGRFSIAICNEEGRTDWSVNCFAPKSHHVVSQSCNDRQQCQIKAEDFDFGENPCPETHRYLEVNYNCITPKEKNGSPWLSASEYDSETYYHKKKSSKRVPITAAPTTTTTALMSDTTKDLNTTTTTSPFYWVDKSPISAAPVFLDESSVFSVSSSTSTLIKDDHYSSLYCPSRRQRGIHWPTTHAGTTAIVRCPNGSHNASWTCNQQQSGQVTWNHGWPNFTDCESEWLITLRKAIVIPNNRAKYLEKHLIKYSLFGGDIKAILDIISSSVPANENNSDVLYSWMKSLSLLLEPRNSPAWKDLLEYQPVIFSKFFSVVEDLGGKQSSPLDVKTPNIHLTSRRLDKESNTHEIFYFNKSSKEFGLSFQNYIDKPSMIVFTSIKNMMNALESSEELVHASKLYTAANYVKLQREKLDKRTNSIHLLFELEDNEHIKSNNKSYRQSRNKTELSCLSSETGKDWSSTHCEIVSVNSSILNCVCYKGSRFFYARLTEYTLTEEITPYSSNSSLFPFILIIIMTSSAVVVVSLLVFILLIVYCRRVKIQDKWDRPWIIRKREDRFQKSTSVKENQSSKSREYSLQYPEDPDVGESLFVKSPHSEPKGRYHELVLHTKTKNNGSHEIPLRGMNKIDKDWSCSLHKQESFINELNDDIYNLPTPPRPSLIKEIPHIYMEVECDSEYNEPRQSRRRHDTYLLSWQTKNKCRRKTCGNNKEVFTICSSGNCKHS